MASPNRPLSAREFLSLPTSGIPFIPELHADDCDNVACARCVPVPQPELRLYTTPDHRVWSLSAEYVDNIDGHWRWDGNEFDPVAGPEMVRTDSPELHLSLIGLAKYCALHSDTTEAVAHGELLLQLHDQIEAGLTGGQA